MNINPLEQTQMIKIKTIMIDFAIDHARIVVAVLMVATLPAAPCRIDHISQAGPGTIRFDRLMPLPPTTRKGALAVRDRIHIVNR